jgi:2-polyprenyl-3-methyl-5-hydroxy-6-metoxy-1,4-benzoquinol methylase
MTMVEYKYPLDNKWIAARERLAQLEAVWDPWTIRNFEKVGVKEGWHCLEVAGGGGSVAEWLCRQVGGSGHVVATDIQPHFLIFLRLLLRRTWKSGVTTSSPIRFPSNNSILFTRVPC